LQCEYSGRAWHLEYQVGVVRYHHELGDSWSVEDGMVGGFEICNLELDVLGALVFPCPPKGN
jgi:hypothetical protein